MKIYVASSWRNKYQQNVVIELRKAEHKVYDFKNPEPGNNGFAWSEIDVNWQNWNRLEYKQALQHPIAKKGFKNDFDNMKLSDCCVLVLPCGRSAHTEAGWMKGRGKKVYIYMPEKSEPELMYKIYDKIIFTIDDLLEVLNENKH